MKVFFNAPIRGKKLFGKEYAKIYSTVEELGFNHLYDLLQKVSEEKLYGDLEQGGLKAYQKLYEDTIDMIKSADISIFECSVPSLGIGFQIQKSLDFNRPTIILYKNQNIPHFFAGTQEDKFIVKKYTETNLKSVLKEALDEAKQRADKRFNFFISPRLLQYLENESKREGVTKSTFIRSLILNHMKGNNKK